MRFSYAMALSGLVWTVIAYVAGFPALALLCLVGAGACMALSTVEVPWWVKLIAIGPLARWVR